ncbi:MAG: lipid-A-disaccharide synthase [Bacteroidales bacterium]|nr:lipid-A-disaccharide synthase [Bacteroidales bacterium]
MKYYIIAGEASGDLHGSNLMRAIVRRDAQADIRYWGGDRMAAIEGRTTMVKHIRDLAFMGFVEVVQNLRTVLGNIAFCKQDILAFRPDVMVFIDYPGFNLKIAKFTRQQGFRNVYYISPQVWAWKRSRLKAMRRDLDMLCYILPLERDFFARVDFPQALYVGHPLIDEVNNYRHAAGEGAAAHAGEVIALLPGSRKMELRKMMPPMLQLARRHPEYRFVVAGMSLLGEPFYRTLLGAEPPANVEVRYDSTYDILSQARAAVVCSGTATLEAAIFRVPQVVCYKANALSVAIAKAFAKVRYISLVNLIADRTVVRELIQQDLTDGVLEQEFRLVADDADTRERMLRDYDAVVALLGNGDASDRTAEVVVRQAAASGNNNMV